MGEFVPFNRLDFETVVQGMCDALGYTYFQDVTADLHRNNHQVTELVYAIKTEVPFTTILLCSTVCNKLGYTRENSRNTVRVILTVRTPQGRYFKEMKRLLRTESLYERLFNTLLDIKKEIVYGHFSIHGVDDFEKGVGV